MNNPIGSLVVSQVISEISTYKESVDPLTISSRIKSPWVLRSVFGLFGNLRPRNTVERKREKKKKGFIQALNIESLATR